MKGNPRMGTKNLEDKNDYDIGRIIVLPEGGLRFEDKKQNILGYYNPKDSRVTNKYHHLIGDCNGLLSDLMVEIFTVGRSGRS